MFANFFKSQNWKKKFMFCYVFFLLGTQQTMPPTSAPPPQNTHTHTHTHNCDKPLQQASLSMVDRWMCAHNSIKCRVLHLICGIAT